ncbi:unnamed protein product, partial [Phaeothamnion confervicola]
MLNVSGGLPYSIDASPGYVYSPRPVLANLRRLNPEAGVILMLREPVARALSHYNYMTKAEKNPFGPTMRPFAEIVRFELDALQDEPAATAVADMLRAAGSNADGSDGSGDGDGRKTLAAWGRAWAHLRHKAAAAGHPYAVQSPVLSSLYGPALHFLQDWAT